MTPDVQIRFATGGDVPLIRGILKGIDPYAPAQAIIRDDRLPPALTKLPEFPCDHLDLSARLRRGLAFPVHFPC